MQSPGLLLPVGAAGLLLNRRLWLLYPRGSSPLARTASATERRYLGPMRAPLCCCQGQLLELLDRNQELCYQLEIGEQVAQWLAEVKEQWLGKAVGQQATSGSGPSALMDGGNYNELGSDYE